MSDFPRTLKIATVWLLLGALVFLGFQALQAQQERTRIVFGEQTIEIRRSSDGHYHWPGKVNGMEVEFLVDTGATTTALPEALAREAGLRTEGRVQSSTAGGIVRGSLARADVRLQGGIEASSLRVTVLPDLSAPLLGMDVLGRLRISQHQGVLTIDTRER